MIAITIPVRIESSLNLREHWSKRAKRSRSHRVEARFGLRFLPQRWSADLLPCTVVLTRIAPRELDDDNLSGGFKSVRDGVADFLGIDDRDKRVSWIYRQEKGSPKQYACRIEVVPANDRVGVA